MKEKTRRILFLVLFSLVLYHMGGHLIQSFVNYKSWSFLENGPGFRAYHYDMSFNALWLLMIPRMFEIVGAVIVLRFPPTEIKRSLIAVALVLGLFAFLWTAIVLRPIHVALDEFGNTAELLARLSFADTIRLVPEGIRALLYVWMMWLIVRAKA